MRASRSSTVELPSRPAGAFFRWETPGEPIAVHFHQNIVELLGRDLIHGRTSGVAGVLLGRFEPGRELTLIVEDYESIPNSARVDVSGPGTADRHLLEQVIDRWHSRSEKRISVVGFYRSCPEGREMLASTDMEISSASPAGPGLIFLVIEHQVTNGTKGSLYLIRNGVVVWTWNPVCFDRKTIAESGVKFQAPIFQSPTPFPQLPKVAVFDTDVSSPRSEKHIRAWSIPLGFGIGISLILIVGIISLGGTQSFHVFSAAFKTAEDPSALGFKLQHVGSDWRLSWDRSAPILLNAAAGRVSITDGFIHKTLFLDLGELRTGSIMYTPITDDVSVRLEVISPESVTLASESARMIGGLLPSSPDPAHTNSGKPAKSPIGAELRPLRQVR